MNNAVASNIRLQAREDTKSIKGTEAEEQTQTQADPPKSANSPSPIAPKSTSVVTLSCLTTICQHRAPSFQIIVRVPDCCTSSVRLSRGYRRGPCLVMARKHLKSMLLLR
jgi:hypothetical protein